MREGWKYKKLGEVCQILMGQSPAGNSINENEGIEFHQGKTCFGDRYLGVSPLFSKSPLRLAEPNSVLLCVRAPVGIPNITDRQVCIGRGLCSLKVEELLDNNFLYYSLLGKQSYFEKNATGSTFKAISSKVVSNTLIAIPSKEVQLDIISELDQINELIRLKKEQLKEYDNLAQSIFYDMFGDPVEDEKGWDVKKLGELVELKNGLNFTPAEDGTKIRIIGVADFKDNSAITDIDAIGFKTIKEEVSQDYYLKDGDILIVRSNGSKELVGRNLIVCTNGELVTYSGFCIRCRIKDLSMLSSLYLNAFLSKREIRMLLRHEGRGANISNINQKVLSSQRVPLPPLPLQQEFSSRIEQIEKLKAEVQKTITDLETLLASRMQYWFE